MRVLELAEQDRKRYRIAVIAGDGIGAEVVPEGMQVLDEASKLFGFSLEWEELPWSCGYYRRTGRMMPVDGLEKISGIDAIYLGAVGDPEVPDHLSLWGLLIPIRRTFKEYANVRPVRLLRGVRSPLANATPEKLDYIIVRENNEGEYSEIGGRLNGGTEEEIVVQESIFTRRGVDRIIRYAFELALERPRRKVTSATKSNGIIHTMPFWDERFRAISARYPQVATDHYHIDILTAHLVQHPEWFDVVVASNLFGDILSDLGPATAGSIGIAPSGNINPEHEHPSMFEPVHGSAPDIAGKGIANPIAQIWSGAMMLEHLGRREAAKAVVGAIEAVIAEGRHTTRDLGGGAGTRECGKAVRDALSAAAGGKQ